MIHLLSLLFFFAISFLYGEDLTTSIKADVATFDGIKIDLEGNVLVENESLELHADKAKLLRDEEKKSHIEFPWAELENNVKAKFYNQYHLECEKVNLNYLTKTLLFSGEKRLIFYNDEGKIFADSALVDFEEENGTFEIAKITLIGVVEMQASSKKEIREQYAMADIVECFPKDKMVFLKAISPKRVLFFDKLRGITISSEMVKAFKKNGKEIIEGIGDVRFTFKEEELNKIKNRFNSHEETAFIRQAS